MQTARRFSSAGPRGFDWALIILALTLLGLGLLMVRSATATLSGPTTPLWERPVIRQAANAGIGLIGLVVASLINYRLWGRWRWPVYGAIVALLAAVLVAGHVSFGAQSWFDLRAFALQPSELAKVALILVLARFLADHETQIRRGTALFTSALVALPVLLLTVAQPDMGTAAVMGAIWVGMLLMAGLRPRHAAILALAGVILAPLAWSAMQPYMRERIMMVVNPHSDPSGRDYNVIQALIAIGSGGLWGKGLGQGTQSQLFFLRVRHTDYIFSVLAEELGFVGCMLVLTLLAALIVRIVRVGSLAGDAYGRLVATGVAIMIFVQVAVNVGFNVGMLPVTGLPLPLISYGGSSLVATLAGLGLVESIALYHQPSEAA